MKYNKNELLIVCTIGPSSRSEVILKKMMMGGMNVARLNFAHGSFEEHAENIRRIKHAAAALGKKCQILADLPGPKIRLGKLKKEPVILKKGNDVCLTTREINGTSKLLPVRYEWLPRSVKKGGLIYLNDGFIQLQVHKIIKAEVHCKVLVGGSLLSFKGLNLPQAKLFVEPVTDEDLHILEFGLKQGLDLFGISFVEKAGDVQKVKDFAMTKGQKIRTVAKIERAEAIQAIASILHLTDAIMVARGDLGVQIPIEQIPIVQKQLIFKANQKGVPVITATQMLESMVHNIRPTRAEVTDVANAILDGTDGIMLSEETAIGEFPVETVQMMTKIALTVELNFPKTKK